MPFYYLKKSLRILLLVFFCYLFEKPTGFCQAKSFLNAVTGHLPVDSLYFGLSHEHIVTNFTGADSVRIDSNKRKAIETVLPHLLQLKKRGINTLFECTPSFIGKDVKLLMDLSALSGVHIVTNTGWYAAVERKYLPPAVYLETAAQIAKRWINDYEYGIDGTGIKPGFIKIGVGEGALDSIEQKLFRAAVITSKRTGLTIAVHTGDYAAALSEYQLIVKLNHTASKLIWVHAQNGTDEQRIELAKKGVWISLDGMNEKALDKYISAIINFKKRRLLHRLLLSHDDGWSVNNNGSYDSLSLFGNGNSNPYTTISELLIPELKRRGFTDTEINLIFCKNVKACFQLVDYFK